jgi:predicted type IV restriction endonuclease
MVPKRVADRLARSVGRFQQVLQLARDRDVNEADTVSIIKDMLAEVFGYDKYMEVTSEFAVRGTFCDLAIKVENKVEYLIEAKAIGLALKDSHLRQAIEYGANNGIQWVMLTNGVMWQLYKIRFEKPINCDLVCSINFLEIDPKNEEQLNRLYLLCKEGLSKDAREQFHEKLLVVNRFMLGALILGDEVLAAIRRELRKLSDGLLVDAEEISHVLTNEVLKRDVLEGEEAGKAQGRVRRFYGKVTRRPRETTEEKGQESAPAETEPKSLPNVPHEETAPPQMDQKQTSV